MDSENSIHLVKDFIISKTAPNGRLDVKKENIQNLDSNSFGQGTSIQAKKILDCLQMLMGTETVYRVGWGPPHYTLYIYETFYEPLHRILPKCSIHVRATVKYTNASTAKTYELRIDIAEHLGKNYLNPQVFATNGLTLASDVTADIFIRWPEPKQTKIKLSTDSFLENLFRRESSKDLQIVAGNGAEVKCHRIVFEAHSDVLTAMLSPENGLSESRTGRVVLKENSEEGIRLLVRYLYGMELITSDLSSDVTVELFQLAHKYEMKELEDHLCKFLLGKGSDWFRADSLLELYFHVKHLDGFKSLQEHALKNLLGLSLEVRNCERFKELNRSDPASAAELLFKLLDMKP